MLIFLHEFLWVLFFIGLFSCCGWFAVTPFIQTVSYPLFLSPMLGLLFSVCGVACFYSIFNFSVFISASLSLSICIVLSLFTAWLNYQRKLSTTIPFILIFFTFVLAGVLTYLNSFSSIHLGEPAFLFSDGADHLGYAQVADWLNHHLVSESPPRNLAPTIPHAIYQSWPAYMFYTDPRFGSFFTLAIISLIQNVSGMFAYDMTCALVLIFSYLGLAAIFARSRWGFILLSLGLLTTHWFSYAQSGYLGKILGFPSTLLVLGLFLTLQRPISLYQVIVLTLLAVAAASMHFAMATAGFLLAGGGIFLLLNYIYSENKLFKENLAVLVFLILIIILATGSIFAPVSLRHIPNPVAWTWKAIFPALFDLEKLGMSRTHLSNNILIGLVVTYHLISIYFIVIALRKRELGSVSLLITPFILLNLLFVTHVYWIPQLVGVFYAWFLCGSIRLVDDVLLGSTKKTFSKYSILVCFIAVILFHLPRLLGDINRYAGSNVQNSSLFTQREMDELTHFAQNKSIIVSINGGINTLPLLVEIGKKYPDSLQFTDATWKAILGGYRDWAPQPLKTTPYYIISTNQAIPSYCQVKLFTRQYNVLKCSSKLDLATSR